MQVTETHSEGLKREYKVLLPAEDLASQLEQQLVELKTKVRINGFRPGKVPVAHLRRLYGKSVMADIVQNAVTEANRKIVEENGIRLAQQPRVDFPEDQSEVEQILAARGDLAFTVNVEVLPTFEIGAFSELSLERLTTPVSEADVDEALQRLVDTNKIFTPRVEGEAAASGDKITMDFVGRIDGVAFEGGTSSGVDVVLGSNSFIAGFEDQLVGARAGEDRKVTARFPDDYQNANLAGKEAEFDVSVKAIAAPAETVIDDAFAKGFNFEGLDKLREALQANLEREFARASRDKLKRALLDALDQRYAFELPQGLVDQEFDNIWRQIEAENARSGQGFEQEGGEEAARAEYRRIAERRVRLGLLLAEVGAKAKVDVSEDELSQALVERARQFPGQEQAVWNYYRKNADAMAQLRAPLVEEKVVDHILAQAAISERQVAKEDLFKAPDEEEAA
jgi:trigger factor